jgi:ligand-binding sensor domain-containing protein
MPRFTIILFLFISVTLFAHEPASVRFDIQSGLPSNEVYDVLKDKNGLLWFATDRGVASYDGYQFDVYTVADGLTDNTVFQLYEDWEGKLWMITYNGRLCYMQNRSVYEYKYNQQLNDYLQHIEIIHTFQVQKDGSIDIGFITAGILHISPAGLITKWKKPDAVADQILQVEEDPEGRMLMGINEQSLKINFGVVASRLNNKELFTVVGPGSISTRRVDILKRKNGNVVISYRSRVVELLENEANIHTYSPTPMCFFEDHQGGFWTGAQDGVYYHAPGMKMHDAPQHWYADVAVISVCEDHEGGFWLCTQSSGVIYIPDINVLVSRSASLVTVNPLMTVYKHVLYRIDNQNNLVKDDGVSAAFVCKVEGLGNQLIADEQNNRLLFTSHSGFYQIRMNNVVKFPELIYKDIHRTVIPVSDTAFIMSEPWGVFLLSPSGMKYLKTKSGTKVRTTQICLDHSQQLWIGTITGLLLKRGDSLFSQNFRDERLNVRITAIAVLQDGRRVMSTSGKGILIDDSKTIRSIGLTDGLPSLLVHTLTVDDKGIVWAATAKGLCSIKIADQTVTVFQYPLFNLFSPPGQMWPFADSGRLFIMGWNSFISCGIGSLNKRVPPPPILIKKVSVNDSDYTNSSGIGFGPEQVNIKISYAGLSYRMGGQIRYRYRLHAADDWSYTTSNEITFPFLSHGQYTFEISAQNENGMWSSKPATFSFVIYPPFWRSGWFLVVAVLLFLVLTFLIVRFQIRRIRRRNKLRVQVLEFRQQVLAAQMNPHFIFNALNTIQANVLNANQNLALLTISRFAKLMRSNLESISSGWISLNEELESLSLYLEIEKTRFHQRFDFEIIKDDHLDINVINVPPLLLQPIAENAVRHGIMGIEQGGQITIKLYFKRSWLHVIIEDNGIGREASRLHKGLNHQPAGSGITAERLKTLCSLTSVPYCFETEDLTDAKGTPCGTRVTMNIPVSTKNDK